MCRPLVRYRLLAEVGRRRTPDLPHEHLCVLSLPERVLCLVEHRRGSTCRSDPRRLQECNGWCDRRCGNPGTKSGIRRIRPGLSCRVLYDQAFVFSLVLRDGLGESCGRCHPPRPCASLFRSVTNHTIVRKKVKRRNSSGTTSKSWCQSGKVSFGWVASDAPVR